MSNLVRSPEQQISDLTSALERSHEEAQLWQDAAEALWVVVANVSGSDWGKQSQEWRDAAAKWRDNYFGLFDKYELKRKPIPVDAKNETLPTRRSK